MFFQYQKLLQYFKQETYDLIIHRIPVWLSPTQEDSLFDDM